MDSPFRIQRLPQDRETPPRESEGSHCRWMYAYARSPESQAAGDLGQDCLALEPSADRFAFALCDGVSQSFFGDLAASALADALIGWMARSVRPGADAEELAASLDVMLRKLCVTVSEEVDAFPVPRDLAPLVADVLEEKRQLGSESTFVCGTLDFPGPACPEGQLFLAWLGDSRCRIWRSGHEVPLEGSFSTSERWSSRRGSVGSSPHLHLGPLDLQRLAVYSDGLALLDGGPLPLSCDELARRMDEAHRRPTSDDISYLDVKLLGA